MSCITYKYSRGGLLVVLLTAVMIFGCSGGNKVVKKDPFLEKWQTMAETQLGATPAVRDRADIYRLNCVGMDTAADDVVEVKRNTSKKSLPVNRISLKMNKADINTVLRALALDRGINIIIGGKNELKGEITIDFRDVPWDQAFTSLLRAYRLVYSWEGDILEIKTAADRKDDIEQKVHAVEIQQLDRLVTCVIPIYYITLKPSLTATRTVSAKGELSKKSSTIAAIQNDYSRTDTVTQNYSELTEILASFLTGQGSVGVETNTNSVIIQATPNDIKRMMPIIEKLDKPKYQIRIKANIVETTKELARQLGIQWGGMRSSNIGNEKFIATGGSNAPVGSLGSKGLGVNFPAHSSGLDSGTLGLLFGTIGGNLLEVQLQALQKDSMLNILSSPSITTQDNQMAFTENGERVPINTQTVSSGAVTNTTVFIDAVLRLEINPHVIDDQTLSMKIIVKKDEVDLSRNVAGNPYIIKKQTETSLIVRNGETIVISGLTKQRNLDSDAGIPGLKDIPVLGWLFKGDDRSQRMEEVLIFITPNILPPYQAAVTPADTAVLAPAKPETK